MTLPELIELKKKIEVYKSILFEDEVKILSQEERFKFWLPKLDAAQEKLSNFILENEGKNIIF